MFTSRLNDSKELLKIPPYVSTRSHGSNWNVPSLPSLISKYFSKIFLNSSKVVYVNPKPTAGVYGDLKRFKGINLFS